MDFKLDNGPWQKFFEGKFEDYDTAAYSNPESQLLVAIYDKEGDKIKGAVIEAYKVLFAKGEMSGFMESIPRELIMLTKHKEKETTNFILIGSKPSYTNYTKKEFEDVADKHIALTSASAKMLIEIAKAYDIELKELYNCNEKIREEFFSQPLLAPMLASNVKKEKKADEITPQEKESKSYGEVILGITKDDTKITEPLQIFKKTIIDGGDTKERLHMMHLLMEGALLSNVPLVLMGGNNAFLGLSNPTKKRDELARFGVMIEPIGFPSKDFYIPENVKADLGEIDAPILTELFGTGDAKEAELLTEIMSNKKFSSIAEMAKEIESKSNGDITEFTRSRVSRILKLMEVIYPHLFGGANQIENICKAWVQGIGRAGVVHTEDVDARGQWIVTYAIVKGLLDFYKSQGKSKTIKAMLFIPNADLFIPNSKEGSIFNRLAEVISELSEYGMGFALECKNGADLSKKIIDSSEARASIIKANDTGIQLKGRKNYRVLLRPGLSACTELE